MNERDENFENKSAIKQQIEMLLKELQAQGVKTMNATCKHDFHPAFYTETHHHCRCAKCGQLAKPLARFPISGTKPTAGCGFFPAMNSLANPNPPCTQPEPLQRKAMYP